MHILTKGGKSKYKKLFEKADGSRNIMSGKTPRSGLTGGTEQ